VNVTDMLGPEKLSIANRLLLTKYDKHLFIFPWRSRSAFQSLCHCV